MTLDHYDLIIVGRGQSGIFTAYEMKKLDPSARILMIEKAARLKNENAPNGRQGVCVNCSPCNITTGFSGSGSFSDGKLSINDHGEVGGDLVKYIGHQKFGEILAYTDGIYLGIWGGYPGIWR